MEKKNLSFSLSEALILGGIVFLGYFYSLAYQAGYYGFLGVFEPSVSIGQSVMGAEKFLVPFVLSVSLLSLLLVSLSSISFLIPAGIIIRSVIFSFPLILIYLAYASYGMEVSSQARLVYTLSIVAVFLVSSARVLLLVGSAKEGSNESSTSQKASISTDFFSEKADGKFYFRVLSTLYLSLTFTSGSLTFFDIGRSDVQTNTNFYSCVGGPKTSIYVRKEGDLILCVGVDVVTGVLSGEQYFIKADNNKVQILEEIKIDKGLSKSTNRKGS